MDVCTKNDGFTPSSSGFRFRAAGLGNWQVTRHDRLLSGSFFIHSGSGFFFIKMFIHAVKEYGIIGPMRGEVVGT